MSIANTGLIKMASTVAALSAVTFTVLTVLSGCSGGQKDVQLPTQSGQTPREAPGDPANAAAASGPEAAKNSYSEFVAILSQADSLPDATRRQHLSRYMNDPQLSHVLKIVKQHKSDNLATYGSVIVHILSVDIHNGHAVVRDCQDARNSGLRNALTNKKINRGIPNRHIEATLRRGSDRRWRVSEYNLIKERC